MSPSTCRSDHASNGLTRRFAGTVERGDSGERSAQDGNGLRTYG
jgi:hypothetical protein